MYGYSILVRQRKYDLVLSLLNPDLNPNPPSASNKG
jgi:hypothetical protein